VDRQCTPNIDVVVLGAARNRLLAGDARLEAPADEEKLEVTVAPAQPQYLPGESAKWLLQVKDARGAPVKAALSLSVVDEAIYDVVKDTTPPPESVFGFENWNRISTNSSFTWYFYGSAGTEAIRLAKLHKPLAQLKPERPAEVKVRKAFPDTAYWSAHVETDANGKAEVKMQFPDAITQWRATARAITMDTRGGVGKGFAVVRKNVILRPSLPRFLREGDEVTLSGVVHNYLSESVGGTARLVARGLELLDGAERPLSIGPRGEQVVQFRVRPSGAAQANVVMMAETKQESDGVELVLPVQGVGALRELSKAGSLREGNEQQATIALPENASRFGREVRLSVSPSIAGAALDAMDYLFTYPYGCTEQTLSVLVPSVRMRSLIGTSLSPEQLRTAEKLESVATAKLIDYQNADGGWGYWRDDTSDIFATALLLTMVDPLEGTPAKQLLSQHMEQGRRWLRGIAGRTPNMEVNLLALLAWATKDRSVIDAAWEKRQTLQTQGWIYLGQALLDARDARATAVVKKLEELARKDSDRVWWSSEIDYPMGIRVNSDPDATAGALRVLLRANRQHPLSEPAVRWLATNRQQGHYWFSTRQTSTVILALADFMEQNKEVKAAELALRWNGEEAGRRRWTEAEALGGSPLQVKVDAKASNQLVVEKQAGAAAWWSASARWRQPVTSEEGNSKFNVRRDYFRLVVAPVPGKTVYTLEPVSGPLRRGDVLVSRVVVNAVDQRQIVVEDPIPSGSEFVRNPDSYALAARPDWWRSFWVHEEKRDDRAVFFEHYADSQRTYFSLVKLTHAGRYRINPARAQGMYQPDLNASTMAAELVVEP
jgi:alpha-2-macroglobulin